MVIAATVWVALRFMEFVLSEVNLNRLVAAGAIERCPRQHLVLILLNAAVPGAVFLAARDGSVPDDIRRAALVIAVICESIHWWAILTLRRRWTTGVWVVPGEQPVRRGPYRWLRHPGYLFGGTASSLLPLAAGGLWWSIAVAAGMLAFVRWRIGCEDAAWREFAV